MKTTIHNASQKASFGGLMTPLLFFALLGLMVVMASCNSEEALTVKNNLEVHTTAISAVAAASTYSVVVTSNTAWTATADAAATWCTLIDASATGNGTIIVSLTTNTTEIRTATITVGAGALTKQVVVTQAATAVTPNLTVDETTIPAIAAVATYAILVTSNVAWTATVDAAATWCTPINASATGNGTITVSLTENPKITTRTAVLTVTAGALSRQVSITQVAIAKPTHAASDQLWLIENEAKSIHQIWSDAIVIPACNKTDFDGENADCRDNPGYAGYLYSGYYINEYEAVLCPTPWRVPSKDDFIDLDKALGGNGEYRVDSPDFVTTQYIDAWGGDYGGVAYGGSFFFQGEYAAYWSRTLFDANDSYELMFETDGTVYPSTEQMRLFGLQARCVR
jgi:uncharacterized protein (TIGR02145 family)